ncbi:MAG: hypothetical protein HC828_14430 [Blastochloris sp.]|nr:hypothetical protein [Blastochloris sp.]
MGLHALTATAYRADGRASAPVTIRVRVTEAAEQAANAPAATEEVIAESDK